MAPFGGNGNHHRKWTSMVWSDEAPKESGRFHWRAEAGGRVHSVQVRIKGASVTMKCKTMDVRQIVAGGQWQVVEVQPSEDELAMPA